MTSTNTSSSMTFWRNNRLDASFTLTTAHVADLFLDSPWSDPNLPLDRALPAFLTENTGPISAVWDNNSEYDHLVNLIAGRRIGAAILREGHPSGKSAEGAPDRNVLTPTDNRTNGSTG